MGIEILRFLHLDALSIGGPLALVLLLSVPLVFVLGAGSLSGMGAIRHHLATAVRCLLIVCLVLALSHAECIRSSYDQTVIFLIDHSKSIRATEEDEATKFVQRSQAKIRAGKDRIGVVRFDGEAAIEQLPAERLQGGAPAQPLRPHQTNIAKALRLAMAMFPADTARRVVVISDGNENAGRAVDELRAFEANEVSIDVAPARYERAAEVLIEKVVCPSAASLNSVMTLTAVIRSQQATAGRVAVYLDDVQLPLESSDSVKLNAGLNTLAWKIPLHHGGANRFRVAFVPDHAADDTMPENNQATGFTLVGDPNRTLLLANPDEMASAGVLREALEAEDVRVDAQAVGSMSIDPLSLLPYSLVILQNVPAYSLAGDSLRTISSYVHEQGGGLIAIGGDRSFSVGGYFQTPLEDVLPVETNRDQVRMLQLALVLIIDRSGSMAGDKLELAKKAGAASADLLSRLDELGVIAFASDVEWISPLAKCSNKAAVKTRIANIGLGGGTELAPAMSAATQAMRGSGAATKHVIILTDGRSQWADFDSLARGLAVGGVTITTVGVGPDVDADLLRRIAKLGKGRYYPVTDPKHVPQIFARETMLVSRSNLSDEPFVPQVRADLNRLMSGVTESEIPALGGYVVTVAKPGVDVTLLRQTKDRADPVLASWQAGLGRAVAFTSGGWASNWGHDWAGWPQFGRIWAQICRWTSRTADARGFEIHSEVDAGKVRMRLEAADRANAPLKFLTIAGQAIGPKFVSQPLTVRQTGTGLYETEFEAGEPGSYVVQLAYQGSQADGESVGGVVRTGVSVAYSPEFRSLRSNEPLMNEMARRTGGRTLAMSDAENVFDASLIRPMRTSRPIWSALLKLAVILFLLDVAIRRVAIDPRKIAATIRGYVADMSGRIGNERQSEVVLTDLKGVREKVRAEKTGAGDAAVSEPYVASASGGVQSDERDMISSALESERVGEPRSENVVDAGGASDETTARLLKSKKRRQN